MSRENVEVVMSAFHAFERGEDFSALWHTDAWVSAPEGWPETGPFEGREAVMRQFERLAADWSQHRFEKLQVVAAEGPWVVVEYHWVTRGITSGIESTFDMAAAYRFRGRLMAEAHFRWNRDDALEAAGLSE